MYMYRFQLFIPYLKLGGCPSDWEDGQSLGLGCYKLFDIERRNWYDAQHFCNSKGGHLVEFSNQEQFDVLRAKAKDFQENIGDRYF